MKKVYCIDCKYFWESPREPLCVAPTGKIIVDYIKGDYPEKIFLHPDDEGYPNDRKTSGCTLFKKGEYGEVIRKSKITPYELFAPPPTKGFWEFWK